MPDPAHLTQRQQQWFASVRATLETSSGRSLEEWAGLARACPETGHRNRLAWMKRTLGLGQNYASLVLSVAFPPQTSWAEPQALADALWADAAARRIFAAVQVEALQLPDVIVGQRRGFTAFSRRFQFAAARPVKGQVRLGLALDPSADLSLPPANREKWSERLHVVLMLRAPEQVDARMQALLAQAWEAS